VGPQVSFAVLCLLYLNCSEAKDAACARSAAGMRKIILQQGKTGYHIRMNNEHEEVME